MARFRLPRLRRAPVAPPPPPTPPPPPETREAPPEEKPPVKRPPLIVRWFVRERSKTAPPPSAPPQATLPPAPPSEPPAPKPEPEPEAEEGGEGGLRSAGAALGGAAARVGRIPTAAGRGVRRFWLSMSVHTRRRLALAVGVLAALLVIAFVAVPALPCQFPGGDVCPPSDDAIHLVPDDALAYVHVNVNPDTEQYKVARDVAARVPNLAGQVTDRLLLARVPGPNGSPPNFQRDIAPVVRRARRRWPWCPPAGRPRRRYSCFRSQTRARRTSTPTRWRPDRPRPRTTATSR